MFKKTTAVWCLVCALSLLAVWGQREQLRQQPLTQPPPLTALCTAQELALSYWGYSWDTTGHGVIACGSSPAAAESRERLGVLTAVAGEQITLRSPEPIARAQICLHRDSGDTQELPWRNAPGGGVVITLPEDCPGVYEIQVHWQLGARGSGQAIAAFLVQDALPETT